MIPGSASPFFLGASKAVGGGGGTPVQIERSLRFNSSDSAFLSRTPAVAGSRTTWTWAGWVKRSALGTRQQLFSAPLSSNGTYIEWQNDLIAIEEYTSGPVFKVAVAAIQRDPSAWCHIVFAFDTTIASPSSDRVKIYINGILQTSLSSSSYPSQNHQAAINATTLHKIGAFPNPGNAGNFYYFDGYLADIYFIDGQALTPSSFTEVSATTGRIEAKLYAGSFGTNGFWLPFNNNSTAAALGTDYSGNSNTWTVNNLSVTAGAGNDSLVDTPTSYGTDTGAGGEVRGNYATWNPLSNGGVTLTNGNLDSTGSSATFYSCRSTIGMSSGSWYCEFTSSTGQGPGFDQMIGISNSTIPLSGNHLGAYAGGYGYYPNGNKYNNNSGSSYGNSWGANDVIGIAFDATTGSLYFYKNGTVQNGGNAAFTGLASGPYFFTASMYSTSSAGVWNFGQRAFAYQTPGTNRPAATFLALCDTNLGAPLVALPSTVFNVALDTGANILSAAQGLLTTGTDWIWIKDRANNNNHQLIDTVRGGTLTLQSNTTAAETTYTAPAGSSVAWCWDAGSSTVSNTQGSIPSQVRANVSAGFSIVSWTTPSSGTYSIGHGLGVAPSLVIVKARNRANDWYVYHSSATTTNQILILNSTTGVSPNPNNWGAGVNSTTFGEVIGVSALAGDQKIGYCFAPVVGYSSFGSYTGNGSADGPFVYTGFRPRWVMVKRTDIAAQWIIWDSSRKAYNFQGPFFFAEASNAESPDAEYLDFVSNGFKFRTTNSTLNQGTSIYMAFAENPFQYARAR